MEGSRWCSAADVVADLQRAGGRPEPRQLASACLAWGARPGPAPQAREEDLEESSCPLSPEARAPQPDLRGITHMLRMVQKHSDDDSEEVVSADLFVSKPTYVQTAAAAAAGPAPVDGFKTTDINCNNEGTSNANVITTSKLDPNVAEFVPKRTFYSGDNVPRREETCSPSPRPEESGGDQDEAEREELAAMLRHNINAAPEDGSSGEFKRNKYVAIAKLMKLYSARDDREPLRLVTPDYFERSARGDQPGDGTSDSVALGAGDRHARGAELGLDPLDVRASIDKVTSWLAGAACSPPQPPARLHLGPIEYRVRARPAASPAPAPSAAAARLQAYVPPPSAEALERRYRARAAPRSPPPPPEPPEPRSLWTLLEPALLQKEAERRARAALPR